MSSSIIAGLSLATMPAVGTNVAALLEHRGANAVPAFEVRRPLRSTRVLMGSGCAAASRPIVVFSDPLAHSPPGFVLQTFAFGLVIVGAALIPNTVAGPGTGLPRRPAVA